VTKLKLSDLPPAARARVEAADPAKKKARPGKSRKGTGEGAPCPGTCGQCGEAFPTALAWGKHFDATGHSLWRIDLDEYHSR
jgi:hypothetical protein